MTTTAAADLCQLDEATLNPLSDERRLHGLIEELSRYNSPPAPGLLSTHVLIDATRFVSQNPSFCLALLSRADEDYGQAAVEIIIKVL